MQESGSPVLLEHLFRREAGRMIAWLAGLLGSTNLQLAEDAAQEAMLRAAQTWPFQGIPPNPEAWLFRTAHNYAISFVRRSAVFQGKADAVVAVLETRAQPTLDLDAEQSLRDDELRMVFMCCHPKLAPDAQVALSLKLVGGFNTEEIARIFFSEQTTIAQRIARAKRLIREQNLKLAMPSSTQLQLRLNSVLKVIYLMFSGGYAAHSGEELIRSDVCLEALRLGRLVASSSMGAPRVDALVALMALQAARLPARMDASGDLVVLEEQDRKLWDDDLIALGFSYFDRSIAGDDISEWHIQAAIAATYASATSSAEIDWAGILAHYDQLMELTNSPVVALNRAVVVMKVHGAEAALAALIPLDGNNALQKYHLLPAMQGHVLAALGRFDEAAAAFSAALQCDCTLPEKRFLQRQLEMVSTQRL
ncbi:RNA polymerase sigma factor [Granulicella sp. S156]|uniref:RNA polymerase sigma factor n=1 Tax=Granulicella sp. S156 TaxID=1747224 RepID=UPI00131CE556|nr:sigma-70 family RNA polymerase sigma factor [Granulicella sp. S156]